MTVYTSQQFQEPIPTNTTAGGEIVFRAYWTAPSAIRLLDGDIVRLAQLPAGYAVTDIVLDTAACGTNGSSMAARENEPPVSPEDYTP